MGHLQAWNRAGRWRQFAGVLAGVSLVAIGCSPDSANEGPSTFKTLDGGGNGGDIAENDAGGDAKPTDTGRPFDAGRPVDIITPPDIGPKDVPVPIDSTDPEDVIGPMTCNNDGQCAKVPVAACEVAVCAYGICVASAAPEGSNCSDKNACTTKSVCSAGACQAGVPIDCDDNNECTADSCIQGSGCTYESNTAPCGDGDKCSGQGQCKAGKCQGSNKVACDDMNACTDDVCNPATGICSYKPNNKPCSDGQSCTKSDACSLGKCVPGKLTVCPLAPLCTMSFCNATSGACELQPKPGACNDGDSCTNGDTCKGGKCVANPLGCDDGKACTDDNCDPTKGCVHVANTANCADGACNLGKCKNLTCWMYGDKKGCDDNNPCTKDVCKAGKTCAYSPMGDGAICGDGDACTGKTTCKTGQCIIGTKTDCSDGNACTTDKCEPKKGCNWVANTAICNDGNKCTLKDVCKGGKCSGSGTPKCDDGNKCTADSCAKAQGCVHKSIEGQPCDDGSTCTSGEFCKAGKCAGATNKCDDNKPCTVDNCDAKGECSWIGKTGACDDGNACTTGDTCKAGNCVGKAGASCDDGNPCTIDSCDKAAGKCVHTPNPIAMPQPCDDGDKCTSGEFCKGGKCVAANASKCDDANGCTVDKCDKNTGKCSFAPQAGPCDAGDLCTWGDVCSQGKCVAGKNPTCNDGSPCTKDSCDAKTGKCSHLPTANGSKCNDGLACTTGDACKSGQCTPTQNACSIYKIDFTCGQGGGWQVHNQQSNNVKWAVDQTPAISALSKYGCTLNLNDGKDYCHTTQGSYCQVPSAWVESPIIDATKHAGKLRLNFHTYYDLDGPPGSGNPAYDRPRIEVRSAGNQLLQTILLSKEANGCGGGLCQKKVLALQRDIDVAAGQKFRLRLRLHEPTNYDNSGAGWFIDKIDIVPGVAAEICDNNKDDDGDGMADCKDLDCKGKPVCAEICTDGKDNDYDDKVDCADADCKSNVVCMEALFATAFPCEDGNFVYQGAGKNNVSWAVDATPGSVKAHSGKCSLNFNNGADYCGNPGCNGQNNATGGVATSKVAINTAGYKKLKLNFWSNPWTETSNSYDRAWVQVSKDDFKNCIGGAASNCNGQGINCQTEGTISMQLPKQGAAYHNWVSQSLDVSKLAGSKLKIRYRFASCDGIQNKNPGWFIDDIALVGEK